MQSREQCSKEYKDLSTEVVKQPLNKSMAQGATCAGYTSAVFLHFNEKIYSF